MIDARAKQKIEAKLGEPIRYPKDCDALSESIYTNCHKNISSSTLKRLFGFVKNIKNPHLHTLDVVANYIGYAHWGELLQDMDKDKNVAIFLTPRKKIEELTLYKIAMNKKVEALEKENTKLKKQVNRLKNQLQQHKK
ncbi:MAG TPA: hypothetical protein VF411_15920 [Bacteroidia bacterium]